MLLVRSSSTVSTLRLDAGEGRPDAVVDAAPERHMVARHLPLEIDLVGSFELGGVAVGGAPEQQHRGAGRDVDAAERRVVGHGTHVVAERRLQAQRLFHERRDLLGVLAEMLLKLLVLGQDAHGVAEQARGGLTTGAQQGVQDDVGFEVAEHPGVHAAGDGAEEIVTRLLHRRRKLIGEPGLDLAAAADELDQLVEGQRRAQHRRRVERRAQELVQVAVVEADEAADHRDRHDVADRGHELDGPAVQRPGHALVGDVDDVGLELLHALGDQLGEDGAAVQRVRGRIGGGERLYARVTERETAGEPGVVAVEQSTGCSTRSLRPGRLPPPTARTC